MGRTPSKRRWTQHPKMFGDDTPPVIEDEDDDNPLPEIDELPPLPEPEIKDVDGATMVTWKIPAEAGLDAQVEPGLMLTDDILAMGIFPDSMRAAIKPAKTSSLFGPAAKTGPASGLFQFDNRVVMESKRPWIDYVLTLIKEENGGQIMKFDEDVERDDLNFSDEELEESLDAVVDLFGCFKGISSRTTIDDGAIKYETLMWFEDSDAGTGE